MTMEQRTKIMLAHYLEQRAHFLKIKQDMESGDPAAVMKVPVDKYIGMAMRDKTHTEMVEILNFILTGKIPE